MLTQFGIPTTTEALQVKQAFYSHEYDATCSGGLLAELKVNFNCFQCDFVPRECNRVAHLIAASGYECEQGSEQIMSSLPVHIDVIVGDDLSVHE